MGAPGKELRGKLDRALKVVTRTERAEALWKGLNRGIMSQRIWQILKIVSLTGVSWKGAPHLLPIFANAPLDLMPLTEGGVHLLVA